jgi:poly(3-hydroxybutyrate) depolymerase
MVSMRFVLPIVLTLAAGDSTYSAPRFVDRTHPSKVFGEMRNYRLFLPPEYETDGGKQRYPVIYYFHGHSDRYTLERYDEGRDTVPKIERFVALARVIVIAVDGFVKRDYQGFYGGTPWDVMETGGQYDFGEYFKELVGHVDAMYRTKNSRQFRATSGLSMGGFMSLYLSARYPDLIGSASAFNPGPEFYVGEPGRRILWRPKDHVASHVGTKVRLVRASGDYISQYHQETHAAYARSAVDYEYRRDEYHRHWATSIGETFEFHEKAFSAASLDRVPETWSYTCAYRACEVHGYAVQTDNSSAGYVYLSDVADNKFRVTTRRWAPEGPALADQRIVVNTAAKYKPSTVYRVRDLALDSMKSAVVERVTDGSGRLLITVDGRGHQITIEGPGVTPAGPMLLLPIDQPRVRPEVSHALPLRVYNPQWRVATNIGVKVSSEYPTIAFESAETVVAKIEAGEVADVSNALRARFTAGDGYFAPTRLVVKFVEHGGTSEVGTVFDVLVAPDGLAEPWQVVVLDGRSCTFPVFRQKGNQGGGGPVKRTVTEGKGNGNGVLEPGEQATVWVRLKQGIDPFDKGNWYRAKVYSESPGVVREVGDIAEQKQLEWTGAKERTSLIERVSAGEVSLVLDNESWSYRFTPDVRYGTEKLYQAFQVHRRHVHAWAGTASRECPDGK